jgi:nitrate reductase NapAB chaperone NapD
MDIASVVLWAVAEKRAAVRGELASMAGVQVQADCDDGRFVVTVEDLPGCPTAAAVCRLHDLPGVINASLVYRYCDDALRQEPHS